MDSNEMKLRLILVIWLVLWVNFIARDFYKKGLAGQYITLVKARGDQKRAHTYGVRYYEFLKFAKERLPKNAFYNFVGIEDFSLASRRGIYYLYPLKKRVKADYLLVYRRPRYKKTGFKLFAKLDEDRFILRKQR